MARRTRRQSVQQMRRVRRVTPRVTRPRRSLPRSQRRGLALVEDRRQYHPDRRHRDARTLDGSAQLAVNSRRSLWHGLRFINPRRVLICVRRAVRKEVMFAVGQGGKRGKRKSPRRSAYSDVRC